MTISASRLAAIYDARNRCVRRTTYGSLADNRPLITDNFLTYDSWNLIEERDATGALQDKYIHGANVDEILVRYNGGAIYYHQDGLGSVTHLTDATGSVVESYTYDVYGTPTFFDAAGSVLGTSALRNSILFTSREYLSALGLYDYRNRFYSPSLGRFLQTDSMRFDAGDVNLYRYCGNNPTSYDDPFGLCGKKSNKQPWWETAKDVLKELLKHLLDSATDCPVSPISATETVIETGITVTKMSEHRRVEYDMYNEMFPNDTTNNPYAKSRRATTEYMEQKYPGYTNRPSWKPSP